MIHFFQGRRRFPFFPKKWANSIVRWIAGVHSPTGTISVRNTMSPNDDGSLALDVNVGVLVKEIMERLELRPYTQVERSRFKFHLRGCVDGSSIKMDDGHLGVSREFIDNIIRDFVSPDAASGEELDLGYLTADDLADILAEAGYITEDDLSGYLTSKDIGTTVAAYSHTHSGYAAASDVSDISTILSNLLVDVNGTVKVPLSSLTGNINGHSGTCYVTIENDGSLGHSKNKAFNMLDAACFANNKERTNNKLITDLDIGDGLAADETTHNIKVKCAASGGLTADSNGLSVELMDNGGLAYNATSGNTGLKLGGFGNANGGKVLATDSNGNITLVDGKTVQSFDVVTAIEWTGTALRYKKATIAFSKGALSEHTVANNPWTVINTPTVLAWS